MPCPSAAAISRRAAKQGWTEDPREVPQQASDAALIADLTATAATDAQRDTTAVVLAAAESAAESDGAIGGGGATKREVSKVVSSALPGCL